ncbi:MAG: sulfotransferase family 2 domain-containing protein [Anaerolineae bacterium]|nr:sulfotransferase family 2 domain-containing protein [Anaerolineae bacterium]
MSTTPQHQTVIFLHMPKAGGSTMNHIMDWNYNRVHSISHYRDIPPFIAWPDDRKRQLDALKGQLFYGIHQYLPQPCTYITILRNPVDRVISQNYYNRVRKKRLGEPAHDMTVQELVEIEPFHPTYQLRLLVGGENIERVLHDPLPENAVAIAKQHLDAHFTFAGVLDTYDAALLLLKGALGWSRTFYARQNVNRARVPREAIDPDTIAWLRDQCAPEIELYEYVKQQVEAQIAAQGEDFQRDLARLRRTNAWFERVWHLARPVHGTPLWSLVRRTARTLTDRARRRS